MSEEAAGPHPVTAVELKSQIEAERAGRPFLAYRDAHGERQLLVIATDASELWIGRSPSADIRLSWDEEVSSLHAQIEVIRDLPAQLGLLGQIHDAHATATEHSLDPVANEDRPDLTCAAIPPPRA